MRIGLDFDNTIVCYDKAFYRLALESHAIPETLSPTKENVKAHLQALGKNDLWTTLQGRAYGPRMETANVFPGVEPFIREIRQLGGDLFIVSHRSPKPYSGEDYDLHSAARQWLTTQSWFQVNMNPNQVFFEPTKKEKVARIKELALDCFVDDLEEVLFDPAFPSDTRKILFQPSGSSGLVSESLKRAHNWNEILKIVKEVWTKTKFNH